MVQLEGVVIEVTPKSHGEVLVLVVHLNGAGVVVVEVVGVVITGVEIVTPVDLVLNVEPSVEVPVVDPFVVELSEESSEEEIFELVGKIYKVFEARGVLESSEEALAVTRKLVHP